MKKFKVEVTEILSRVIETDAESEEDAVEKIKRMYRNCDIILNASDYIETNICIKDEK